MLFSPQHQIVPSARGKTSGSETLPAQIGQDAVCFLVTDKGHKAGKQMAAAASVMGLFLVLLPMHQEVGFVIASCA